MVLQLKAPRPQGFASCVSCPLLHQQLETVRNDATSQRVPPSTFPPTLCAKMECQGPSFYQVMLPGLQERMRIPPQFLPRVSGAMDRRLLLKGSLGGVWEVELEKEDDNIFVNKGWNSFLKDFPIHPKDFLLFFYRSAQELIVHVFGKCGCEKKAGHGCLGCNETRKKEKYADVLGNFGIASDRGNHGDTAGLDSETTMKLQKTAAKMVIPEVIDRSNRKYLAETKEEEKCPSERGSREKTKSNTGKRKGEKCSVKNEPSGSIGSIRKQNSSTSGMVHKASPSKDRIRNMISKIVEKDDVHECTPNRVLKQLKSYFGTNLSCMKEDIKLMIYEELLKVIGLDRGSEDDDHEEENAQPTREPNSQYTVDVEKLPIKISSTLEKAPESIHNSNREEVMEILKQDTSTSGLQKKVKSSEREELDLPPTKKQKTMILTVNQSEAQYGVFHAYWEDKICLGESGSGGVIVALKLSEAGVGVVIPEVFYLLKNPPFGRASSNICIGCANEQHGTSLIFLIVENISYPELCKLVDSEAIVIFGENKFHAEELKTADIQKKIHNADLTTTTIRVLPQQIEEHFRVNLLEKKDFVQSQVDLYFQNPLNKELSKSNEIVSRRHAGFTKLCNLSTKLSGKMELARNEVVKQMWAYMCNCNLQHQRSNHYVR